MVVWQTVGFRVGLRQKRGCQSKEGGREEIGGKEERAAGESSQEERAQRRTRVILREGKKGDQRSREDKGVGDRD